jgi:hypothetical protein
MAGVAAQAESFGIGPGSLVQQDNLVLLEDVWMPMGIIIPAELSRRLQARVNQVAHRNELRDVHPETHPGLHQHINANSIGGVQAEPLTSTYAEVVPPKGRPAGSIHHSSNDPC